MAAPRTKASPRATRSSVTGDSGLCACCILRKPELVHSVTPQACGHGQRWVAWGTAECHVMRRAGPGIAGEGAGAGRSGAGGLSLLSQAPALRAHVPRALGLVRPRAPRAPEAAPPAAARPHGGAAEPCRPSSWSERRRAGGRPPGLSGVCAAGWRPPPPSLTCRRPRGPADASPCPPARPWKCCACAATSVRAWRWGTVSSRAARRWPTRPVFKSVSASFSQLRHRKSKTTVLTNACPLWLMVSET